MKPQLYTHSHTENKQTTIKKKKKLWASIEHLEWNSPREEHTNCLSNFKWSLDIMYKNIYKHDILNTLRILQNAF